MQINHDYYALAMYTVADPGEGPTFPPYYFLDQTEAQKAEKNFLRLAPPPPRLLLYLRVSMSAALPPSPHPFLKVLIHHCCMYLKYYYSQSRQVD